MNEELQELKEELSEKKQRYDSLESGDCYDEYDEYLDGVCEMVRIGSLEYYPSKVLESVDPIAYRCGYDDWADSELTELQNEIDDLEEQISSIEEVEE